MNLEERDSKLQVLLVEDDPDQQENLSKLLIKASSGQANIVCASSLEEGLEKDNWANPDVTLLDLGLPDSPDYNATIEHLPEGTAERRFRHPVIVTTGLPDEDGTLFTKCMLAGAENVFFKPFCINATKNLVSSLIAASMRAKAAAFRAKKNGHSQ